MRITRRRSILGAALLLVPGCFYLGSTIPSRGVTRTTAADLSSTTPPLAAFMLRVAASDLALSDEQARLTKELSHDADEVVRPIDEARIVFLEVLVRAMDQRRYDARAAWEAAETLRTATRTGAMRLLHSLARLHAALDPSQRQTLVACVRARFDGWSKAWRGGRPDEHPWLATFAREAFPRDNGPVDDAVGTVQRWTGALSTEVEKNAAKPWHDDARRELIEGLRD